MEKERRKETKENISLEDLTGSRVLKPNIQNVHDIIQNYLIYQEQAKTGQFSRYNTINPEMAQMLESTKIYRTYYTTFAMKHTLERQMFTVKKKRKEKKKTIKKNQIKILKL